MVIGGVGAEWSGKKSAKDKLEGVAEGVAVVHQWKFESHDGDGELVVLSPTRCWKGRGGGRGGEVVPLENT